MRPLVAWLLVACMVLGAFADVPILTVHGRSLLLFESPDGRAWQPAAKPLVKDLAISWEGGVREVSGGHESFLVLMSLNHPGIASVSGTHSYGEPLP